MKTSSPVLKVEEDGGSLHDTRDESMMLNATSTSLDKTYNTAHESFSDVRPSTANYSQSNHEEMELQRREFAEQEEKWQD